MMLHAIYKSSSPYGLVHEDFISFFLSVAMATQSFSWNLNL